MYVKGTFALSPPLRKIFSQDRLYRYIRWYIHHVKKQITCQRPRHKARGSLWEFVGGKVEPGESKEEAWIRECREELSITVQPGKVFMEVTHTYPDLTVHLTLLNASIRSGVPQLLEHQDMRWITPGEIGQFAFCPADEVILEKLKSL